MLGDRRNIELAYSLLFSLPGAPVIRYGDEIGMGDDLSLPEREAVRTPMQWANERNAGFSAAKRLRHPVIEDGVYGYPQVNVEDQRRDPSSLLNWMASMIRLRKESPEVAWGEWELLPTGSDKVLAMCYAWRGNRLLTVHNFDKEPKAIKLRVRGAGGDVLTNLRRGDDSRSARSGAHRIALEEFGYRWYRVGGPEYSLNKIREQ